MKNKENFETIFLKLKAILEPLAANLVLVNNTPQVFYLDTYHIMKNKKPLFFGAVRSGKTYVGFYLMAVYMYPELLEGISAELKKRMQGKSCFNFSSVDERLFEELRSLTQASFDRFKDEKFITDVTRS